VYFCEFCVKVRKKSVVVRDIRNLFDSNVIYNRDNSTDEKCTDLRVLKKIKSESKEAKRFSNDIYYDCEASKIMSDLLTLDTGSKLKGYLQETIQNPFGLLLISAIQVILNSKKIIN
jgi:hypothetical protein